MLAAAAVVVTVPLDRVRAAAQPLAGRAAQRVNAVDHLRHVTAAEAAAQLRRPRIAMASGLAQRGPRRTGTGAPRSGLPGSPGPGPRRRRPDPGPW